MKYTAINIGPIISTLSMARKPRELWAASYLFSHLMKCIYETIEAKHLTIISPDKPKNEEDGEAIKNKVGIYPDRIFIKDGFDIKSTLESARKSFCDNTGIDVHRFEQYFNLMSATIDSDKEEKVTNDGTAIRLLNQELDVLELCNYAADYEASDVIRRLIGKTKNSPLFRMESGDKDIFPFEVNTLAEIATAELMGINPDKWKDIRNTAREAEQKTEAKQKITEEENDHPENSIDIDESDFYKRLASAKVPEWKLKSHHKYFCIVQADGDNVGKTVSHEDLQDKDKQIKEISTALVLFAQKAAKIIEAYGGLPIYAGGDDLLFIAPVIGKDHTNILDLINTIESDAFQDVVDVVSKCGKEGSGIYHDGIKIEASLSFGIAISYYKYPLYEAFESARHLLFDVAKDNKRFPNKKTVAWSLRKHSGGIFDAAFSLKDTELQTQFNTLIKATTDDEMVSGVAHKLREYETLVKTVLKNSSENNCRINALFDNVLEFQDNNYFKAIKSIMPKLYETVGEDNFITTLYSLLRTAKFINGEELHDE